jgi:hypothetical protein
MTDLDRHGATDATPAPGMSIAATSRRAEQVLEEVELAVVGNREPLTLVLAAILAGGHVLIEDFPGLGKTLAARSFAQTLGLDFKRAQFTPDLLPADLTGSFMWDQGARRFEFRRGPLFTGLLLADEINRTPPKTQAALLEAMQEGQVTVEGHTFVLDRPFHVIATANPVEYEGTYPLPEAQLDRFLLKVVLPIPERGDELEIVTRHATGFDPPAVAGAGVAAGGAGEELAARHGPGTNGQGDPEGGDLQSQRPFRGWFARTNSRRAEVSRGIGDFPGSIPPTAPAPPQRERNLGGHDESDERPSPRRRGWFRRDVGGAGGGPSRKGQAGRIREDLLPVRRRVLLYPRYRYLHPDRWSHPFGSVVQLERHGHPALGAEQQRPFDQHAQPGLLLGA